MTTGPAPGVPHLEHALDRMRRVLADVTIEQLDTTVPACPRWAVRGLIAHLLIDLEQFRPMSSGAPYSPNVPEPELDGTGLTSFDELSAELRRTWNDLGGDVASAGMQVAELTLHAWDLATAVGQDLPPDPELDALSLGAMQGMLKPEFRGTADDPGMFGPELPAPDGSSSLDRLLAFSGRVPRPT